MTKLNDEVINLRSQFLRQFIITAMTQAAIKRQQDFPQTEQQPLPPTTKEVNPTQKVIPLSKQNIPIRRPMQIQKPLPRIPIPTQRVKIPLQPQIPRNMLKPSMQSSKEKPMILKIGSPSPQININSNSINLGKISPLIFDPSVQSVECTGPDKPLIVNKTGVIQTTNTVLSTDDIKIILESVSQRTRIPLISGVFKAAFDNYLITAVISDFVGSRFVIQKKTPFTKY